MRFALALSLVAALTAAGCGGAPEAPQSTTPAQATGPTGELGTSSVGEVRIGMEMDEVEAAFGRPDSEEEVSFGGPGSEAPQIDWVWDLSGGEFVLQFQTSDDTVTGYRSFSADLATADGFTVGTPLSEVEQRYGDELREGLIGSGTLLLSEGKPGTYPGITFAANSPKGPIVAIEGGELQPAGD